MRKIARFSMDHNILRNGMYGSQVNNDAVTYDFRMKRPNSYARNTELSQIVYFGRMGCRTDFYLLFRDTITRPAECWNYLEPDLAGAETSAVDRLDGSKDWTREDMNYEA